MFSQSRLDLFTALNVLADELKQIRQAGPPHPVDPAAQFVEYAINQAHVRLRRGWEGASPESAAEHIRNALQILESIRERTGAVAGDQSSLATASELDAIHTRLVAALEGLSQ